MSSERLPSKAYRMLYDLDKSGKSTWVSNVRMCLCHYGFQYVWLDQGVAREDYFIKCFKQRLLDCHWQDWDSHIQNSDRYSFYRTFKTMHQTELYFSLDTNRFVIKAFIQLRLGISKLAVHTQRYVTADKKVIGCRLCSAAREDEMHVLLCCPFFDKLRKDLIPLKFHKYPCNFRAALLLAVNNKNTLHNLVIFVYKALQVFESIDE